jgi:hypothetical protein
MRARYGRAGAGCGRRDQPEAASTGARAVPA